MSARCSISSGIEGISSGIEGSDGRDGAKLATFGPAAAIIWCSRKVDCRLEHPYREERGDKN